MTIDRLCFFDLETTGFSAAHGHRAVEIGVVEVLNRKITQKTFHSYLNPQRDIDKGAEQVHGLSRDFLDDKPLFSDIADKLIDFIQDSTMIAHNASFDESFLDCELNKAGYKRLSSYCIDIVDSLALARKLYPGKKNSLDALCKRLSVENSHRKLHGALLDSQLLAQVYLAMTGGQGTLSFDTVPNNSKIAGMNNSTRVIKAQVSIDEQQNHDKWCQQRSKDGLLCLFTD